MVDYHDVGEAEKVVEGEQAVQHGRRMADVGWIRTEVLLPFVKEER